VEVGENDGPHPPHGRVHPGGRGLD
jgi:hypothetical protein